MKVRSIIVACVLSLCNVHHYCTNSIGSVILTTKVTLLEYDIAGTGTLPKRLDCFFEELRDWCKARGLNLHMTRLTKNQIGLDTAADFPVASLGVFGVCFGGLLLLYEEF